MSNFAVRADGLSKLYRIQASTRDRKLTGGMGYESISSAIGDLVASTFGKKLAGRSGAIWALRDVTFDIQHGEPVGIIGDNGAGKTTLLKVLARITAPTEGSVRMRGRVGSLLEVGTGFHLELTGRENVYLNGAVLGMRRSEITRKFDAIVNFSGVEEFMDTPLKFYSSGMRTRLAFSVAAHLEPEILLVDEVLAVGDVAFQNKCLNKMQEVATQGRTVLFVSHNLGAVKALCPRCMLLEHGRLKFMGETVAALDQYLQSREADSPEDAAIQSWKEAQILNVRTCDSEGAMLKRFPHDGAIHVRTKLYFSTIGFGTHLTLKIYGSNLETVLATHDFEPAGNSLVPSQPGTYEFETRLPAGLLAPGKYYLGAQVSRQRQGKSFRLLDKLDHVGEFDVYDNGSLLSQFNVRWQGLVHSSDITWSRLDGIAHSKGSRRHG